MLKYFVFIRIREGFAKNIFTCCMLYIYNPLYVKLNILSDISSNFVSEVVAYQKPGTIFELLRLIGMPQPEIV